MIITIGRQHGSNGHDIARALAADLGIPCYDKEIVDKAAENSDFSKEILDSYDEKRVANYIIPTTAHYIGMNEGLRLNLRLATAQFDAIRKLAEEGDAIFVGRCADYILRNRSDLVRVFIMADKDFRINCIMKRKGLTEDQAKKLIREVDKDRASYYNYYSDQDWGSVENYDLCLNSGRLDIDGSVKVIKSFIESTEG